MIPDANPVAEKARWFLLTWLFLGPALFAAEAPPADGPAADRTNDTRAARFERVEVDLKPPSSPYTKLAGDFNRDGRLDIAIAGSKGRLVWYANPGWARVRVAESGWKTVGGAVGDLDGDGDPDLMPGAQVWFENPLPNGDPARDPWPVHSISDITSHDAALADLDGDGRLDVVARDQSGFNHKQGDRIHLWRQAGPDRWEHHTIACPHGEGLALADLDADGDTDIVIGGRWFENPGQVAADWPEHITTTRWTWADTKVSVGDINGDGRPDIVLAPAEYKDQTYRLAWYEAPENARASDWAERVVVPSIEAVVHGLQVADMDGDGRLDIVSARMHQGAAPREVAVFFNEGLGRQWSKHVVATTGSHDIQVADFDGDDRPDILGANHAGAHQPIELWLNRSTRPTDYGGQRPRPGDVFREYRWTHTTGDAGGALRVGGRVGYGGGPVPLPHRFDLEDAVRAEIVLEKLLCHDGTRGLAISVNHHDWIPIPEASGIPEPQWEYMHHIYPIVPVPLAQLRSEGTNEFRLRVSDEHSWNWPQNLIYGVHFRVYYDAAKKPHPVGRLISPGPGDVLGMRVVLEAEASSPNGPIRLVEFLGDYLDVNLEGDGEYFRWHGHYHRGVMTNHLGSATAAPWRVDWDTSWVPDQPSPFRLAARITDETDLTTFTEAVSDLTLRRDGLSVELCKPYDVPRKWLTRLGEHSQKFRVAGDLRKAVAARFVWVSWSPGYMEGLYLNDRRVFEREGPRYAYYAHRVPLVDLAALQPGENILKTGMTPRHDGQMVHGMELNWPGIMVLIQYRE